MVPGRSQGVLQHMGRRRRKPIGGVHENSDRREGRLLLPWNQYGIVVVSWVDDDARRWIGLGD